MIDLETSSIAQNPYPTYRALRAAGDVQYDRDRNICYVGDYQTSADLFWDEKTFFTRGVGLESTVTGGGGAEHDRIRDSLSPAFGAARITALEEKISSLAGELAGGLRGKKGCDIVANYGWVIPATVSAWMLGIDKSRLPDVYRWTNAILPINPSECPFSKLKSFIGRFTGPRPDPRSLEVAECRTFLNGHFQQAADKATGGSLTDLVAARWKAGEISESEMVDIGILVIAASAETTSNLIGSAVLILARDTGLQQQLRDDSQKLKPFIEEVLRFEAPVQRRSRRTATPVEILGVPIPEGTVVQCLIGSANRDPKAFSEPEQFLADRQKNRHLSFSHGPHACLGAQLARMQASVALRALLQSTPSITLTDPSERFQYADSNARRGLLRLNVSLAG